MPETLERPSPAPDAPARTALAARRDLLTGWIARAAPAAGVHWLAEAIAAARAGGDQRALAIAFGLCPRRLGRDALALAAADLAAAERVRPGFDPRGLAVDEAGRIALLLAAAEAPGFPERLEALAATADLKENIAVLRALPLLPAPERLLAVAGGGVRSAVQPVFEAIAHRNPLPRERFDEPAWNQMVLKALFIGATLAPIQGLDARANPTLAAIMVDYAHERWAAGRPITPEIWRCVGPFADARAVADLGRVLATGTPPERLAAALALSQAPGEAARAALAAAPDLAAAAAAGRLAWTDGGAALA